MIRGEGREGGGTLLFCLSIHLILNCARVAYGGVATVVGPALPEPHHGPTIVAPVPLLTRCEL